MGIANIINNSTTTSGGEIVRELVNASDGAGLHFDGAVGSIDIASPPDLGTKLSFEFVCKVDDPSGTQNGLLVDFGGGSGRAIFGASSSISGNFGIYYNSAWATFGLNPLTDGSVHHLIASIDGTTATLYDNGNQIATATIGSLNIDGCTDARIGTNFVSTGGFFEGTIYRARFWNKTLSSAEVQTAYERADVDYSSQYGSQTKLIDSDFNGSFDGWNTSNDWATQTNNSNAMQLVANAANQICRTGTQLTKGKRYRVTYTASGVTGSPGFSTAASSHVVAGVITAGTANSFEFTFPTSATSQYFYIKSNASGDAVTLDDISVVQIGAVSDYDLAFANPTQSLTVQDRSGAADGTCSASGVTQVQPVVQLNSTSARIGTTAATPADGQVIGDKITTTNAIQLERVSQYTAKLSCVDSGGNQTLQILGNRSAGSGSSGTDVLIGGQQSRTTGNVLKVDQGSDTYLTIDSSGMVTVTNATEAKLRLQNTKDWGGSDSGNIGTLEFYTTDSSGAGARVVGAVQCAQDAASAAPNGELVFKTALGGGSAAAAVERMRITSAGQVNITGPTSYPETSEHPLLVKAGMANGLSNRYIKLQQTYTGSAKDGIPIVWETNADGSNNKSYGYIRTKADGTVAIGNKAAGAAVAVGTALGTTEHLTIDSTGDSTFSGDVKITGTNPALGLYSTNSSPQVNLGNAAGTSHWSIYETVAADGSQGSLNFYDAVSTSNRLAISSTGLATFSGDLEVGAVSATGASVGFKSLATTSSSGPNTQTSADNTGTRGHYLFYNPNGEVGSIKTSGSATSFNTSSDYRLKENLTPLTGALDRLDALPVYRFNFTADPDTTVDGFVAHEVSAHVPEAVTGEKDAMKTVVVQEAVEAVEAQPATYWEEGDELPEGVAVGDEKTAAVEAVEAVEEVTEEQPDYQGIDQSKLVPLLVAAVKELKAKVDTLENA